MSFLYKNTAASKLQISTEELSGRRGADGEEGVKQSHGVRAAGDGAGLHPRPGDGVTGSTSAQTEPGCVG